MSKPSSYQQQLGDLVAYLEGSTSADMMYRIEHDPHAMAEVEMLRMAELLCRVVLYRDHCPDSDALLSYQAGLLAESATQSVAQHVAQCHHCQHELALLASVTGEVPVPMPAIAPPVATSPSLRERLEQAGRDILAVLMPPPPQPALVMRGTVQHEMLYHAGAYQIILSVAPPVVAEDVRQLEGQITEQHNVERVPHGAHVALMHQGQLVLYDTVDEFGYFVLDNVASGSYAVHIDIVPDRIIIDDFLIA